MLVSIRIWELFFKQETGTYMFSFSDFFFFFFPLFGANLSQKDAKIFQESCRFTGLTEIGLFFFGVFFSLNSELACFLNRSCVHRVNASACVGMAVHRLID